MMAPREVFSVTPFLYAFKRWFTFMGRTSTLPTILTTAQRYEFFSNNAIGISLFVLHTAVLKYRTYHHRGARAPNCKTGRCVAFAAQRPKCFELHIIPE